VIAWPSGSEADAESREDAKIGRGAAEADPATGVEDEARTELEGEACVRAELMWGGRAGDGDKFDVAAEGCADGDSGGGRMKPLDATGSVRRVISKVEFGHESERPSIGKGGCEGKNKASGPRVFAHSGVGWEGEVGHECEGAFAGVIAPEVAFDAQRDVSKSVGIGSIATLDLTGDRVRVENDLNVSVLGDSAFDVHLAENPLCVWSRSASAISRKIEETRLDLEHVFRNGVRRFRGVGSVGAEGARVGVGGLSARNHCGCRAGDEAGWVHRHEGQEIELAVLRRVG